MSRVTAEYTGLPENFISASTSFAITSWFTRGMPAAPWLSIVGRNSVLANQLLRLMCCFCRRGLPLVDATLGSVCSLPLEWGFTLLLSQSSTRVELARLVSVAHQRGRYVAQHGRLIRVFGPIVTYSSWPIVFNGPGPARIEIPAFPSSLALPLLSAEAEERIANEFQPKLLCYFLENHEKILHAAADVSDIHVSLQDTARMLLACIPDDPDFQRATTKALQLQHTRMQAAKWTDIDVVAVEALLFLLHEPQQPALYVGDIARIMMSIMNRRGENVQLEPKRVGTALRALGFHIEPRDQRGYRLRVTQALRLHAHQLAVALDVPAIQDAEVRCEQCEAVGIRKTLGDEQAASNE